MTRISKNETYRATLEKLFPDLEQPLYDELLQNGTFREVKAGETLLKVGQPIRSTILIIDGILKLFREDNAGNEFFIYHLQPGDACSLSMICAVRHESSEVLAKAVTDAVVLTIPVQYMEKWMSRYKSWYQFVITSYRSRFEELLKTIDAIAFTNMDQRLESYLLKQKQTFGDTIVITHQEIANDLNTSREVVSRLLKKMETKGLIVVNRNSIKIMSMLQ